MLIVANLTGNSMARMIDKYVWPVSVYVCVCVENLQVVREIRAGITTEGVKVRK